MNKILTAVAITIALPTAAYAQTAPAHDNMSCCDQQKMADCHKAMAGMMGDHMQGMDMGRIDHSKMGHDMSKQPPAQQQPEQHQNHRQ